MKRIALITLASFMMSFMAMAQNRFSFNISDGISNNALKSKMENQVTRLLAVMDEAQAKNKKSLSFKGIDIDETAQRYILKMWSNKHLRVWKDNDGVKEIKESCLKLGKLGYQIRNIPMEQFPVEGSVEDPYTEVYINFDLSGKIIDFSITRENNQYVGLIQHSNPVNEADSLLIDYYMTILSTAYKNKELDQLESLFSEDALIVTGRRVFKSTKSEAPFVDKERFEYIVKNKREYLNSLKKVFKENKNISVNFTDMEIKRHPSGNYFSVSANQEWNGTKYCDLGKIYIIWDYRDPEKPVILVRVWQYTDDKKQFGYGDFNLR